MSRADSSTGFLSENRELLVAVAAGAVIFLILLGLLGFGGAVGFVGFAAYTVLWLAVAAFVLWLFYRLVVAVERIAHAQQRIAAAQNPPGGSAATDTVDVTDGSDSETGANEGTGSDNGDSDASDDHADGDDA
ncbi:MULTISPECIES: hypothetical protein [Halolamina]|uniref:Uncharacterized protein n=1 Tax=Halolamina pelagica TaxID=699431 RepID=A0A1I5SV98_9EURY|nr:MULTISPECIES: hypothetical protein [Halolamina]NHX36875.1 hypothetical protein [Halolamina sp. R1-12]SFP74690.1 hypothetical protein SAMN05216277_10729 [Halolamina pelagica]